MTARPAFLLALVIAMTFTAYSRSLYVPFVFDDGYATIKNPRVVGSEPISITSERSVLQTTFRINYALGGSDPVGYHVVSLGLHLVNVLLVWVLLSSFDSPFAALCGAAFFSLHPLQTQAVIYISARSELLACFFGLMGMLLFERRRFVLASLSILLAIFSKEIAIVFPLMIGFRALIQSKRSWPYIVPIASIGILACAVFAGHLEPADRSLGDHVTLQAGQFVRYLGMILLPVGQSVEHDAETLPVAYSGFALGLLSVVPLLILNFCERRPTIAIAIGWMMLAVLPRFFIVTPELMFEHHMYVVMLGVGLLVADLCDRSLSRVHSSVSKAAVAA